MPIAAIANLHKVMSGLSRKALRRSETIHADGKGKNAPFGADTHFVRPTLLTTVRFIHQKSAIESKPKQTLIEKTRTFEESELKQT